MIQSWCLYADEPIPSELVYYSLTFTFTHWCYNEINCYNPFQQEKTKIKDSKQTPRYIH